MTSGLRRELGTLEAYAALVGILIGAGIFKVTSGAWALTGPSVILGHLVLAVLVLATSVPYAVYLSTPLGWDPGGEYAHVSRTFGGYGLAFVGAWLKIISYVGALAYLALAFADYLLELAGPRWVAPASSPSRLSVAAASLAFFYVVHVLGVRWFGRLQLAMLALLGLSIVVLVVPGLFAIRISHYQPFFTHGASGFAAALPPLFFAYAGFESLAQTAGEVRDSRRRLPRVFLLGITATTAVYFLMNLVAFGVLPGERLGTSAAPMADVGAVYLPVGAASFVTLGAVMAIATSLNATMLVPSRLALMLARDRVAPAALGQIAPQTGTPVRGLTLTLLAALALLVSGQVSLALNVAVLALLILYLLHGVALVMLPRLEPRLFSTAATSIPRRVQLAAALLSIGGMAGLVLVQVVQDAATIRRTTIGERVQTHSLTAIELVVLWGLLGAAIYALSRRRGAREGHDYAAGLRWTAAVAGEVGPAQSGSYRTAGLPEG